MGEEPKTGVQIGEPSDRCIQTFYARAEDIPESVKENPTCVRPAPESVSANPSESRANTETPLQVSAPKHKDKYEELLAQAREILKDPEFMEEVMALARLKMGIQGELGSLLRCRHLREAILTILSSGNDRR